MSVLERVLFLLVVLAIGLAFRYRHAIMDLVTGRDKMLRKFAADRGWTYHPAGPELIGTWAGTPFASGDNRRAKHVVRGDFDGRRAVAFDYLYRQRTNRSRETYRFSVVSLELPGVLPNLQVTREGPMGGVVAAAVGLGDLRFENDTFNQTFRVVAGDDRYGHAVVHPRMMELLLARGWISWRIERNTIVAWSRDAHEPQQILSRLSLLSAVADLIPPFIWRDYAGIDPRGDGLAPGSG
jgi:hypothetical protein